MTAGAYRTVGRFWQPSGTRELRDQEGRLVGWLRFDSRTFHALSSALTADDLRVIADWMDAEGAR